MKKFKKMISWVSLIVVFISSLPVQAVGKEKKECTTCTIYTSQVTSSYFDSDGNQIIVFDDDTEIIYYENGDIIINDYGHVYGEYDNVNMKPRAIEWAVLGKAIWTALGVCSTIAYVTGHDYCRIVLQALGDKIKYGKYYTVSGNFVPGYIPGCEPRNSGPCNAGYWRYKVTED